METNLDLFTTSQNHLQKLIVELNEHNKVLQERVTVLKECLSIEKLKSKISELEKKEQLLLSLEKEIEKLKIEIKPLEYLKKIFQKEIENSTKNNWNTETKKILEITNETCSEFATNTIGSLSDFGTEGSIRVLSQYDVITNEEILADNSKNDNTKKVLYNDALNLATNTHLDLHQTLITNAERIPEMYDRMKNTNSWVQSNCIGSVESLCTSSKSEQLLESFGVISKQDIENCSNECFASAHDSVKNETNSIEIDKPNEEANNKKEQLPVDCNDNKYESESSTNSYIKAEKSSINLYDNSDEHSNSSEIIKQDNLDKDSSPLKLNDSTGQEIKCTEDVFKSIVFVENLPNETQQISKENSILKLDVSFQKEIECTDDVFKSMVHVENIPNKTDQISEHCTSTSKQQKNETGTNINQIHLSNKETYNKKEQLPIVDNQNCEWESSTNSILNVDHYLSSSDTNADEPRISMNLLQQENSDKVDFSLSKLNLSAFKQMVECTNKDMIKFTGKDVENLPCRTKHTSNDSNREDRNKNVTNSISLTDTLKKSTVPNVKEFIHLNEQKTQYKFKNFNLSIELLHGIFWSGFQAPSMLQQLCMPQCIAGCDIVVEAYPCMGKSIMCLISVLQRIDTQLKECQAVILVPTKELALSTQKMIKSLGRFLKVFTCIGSKNVPKKVAPVPHVVISTPQDLCEMIDCDSLNSRFIKILAVDDVDDMLDCNGFWSQIRRILLFLNSDRQLIILSTSKLEAVLDHFSDKMSNAVNFLAPDEKPSLADILQYYFYVPENWKFEALSELYEVLNLKNTVVYCKGYDKCRSLAEKMRMKMYKVSVVNSDMNAQQRQLILRQFCCGSSNVLITTNLIKGEDFKNVMWVINYDLPNNAKDYVQKILRHFGRKIKVINLVTEQETMSKTIIETTLKINMIEMPQKVSNLLETTHGTFNRRFDFNPIINI
ncbi:probable ATP-dependent RNA helicase ddx52 isoform X2 [Adelges cooleyi]|uniref:probable ATP-dependent RNA helicase ddx52 isoform X2 n=1 Tax=Adelges cooleyi TaxID=133065 RepID=UPI00217FDFD7|nr:probable ATP-dependent RNA helicase ddx52 isoform X2 [Adelges cooleyi]